MDLQPLYEVQERLEHAAVAGTGILSEDFRLKRAWEGLAPLAAASPVFAKISAGLEGLLAAPTDQRGGALLDVLALVDAVVYTQASAGMDGELEPLPPGVGTCQPLSYAQLRPLLEALTGTGGGRFSLIRETASLHPEYFADYRVIPALVAGLGDSYGELADLDAEILARQGPDILPLLEEGFDPTGGRAMARRVEIMVRVGGGRANDFFLARLPQAKKEVRLALIDALGGELANAPLLLELCRTERKGPARDAAYRALARLDAPEGEAYLREQGEREPDKLLELLEGLTSCTASRLTAEMFADMLDWMETSPGTVLSRDAGQRLKKLCSVLEGKKGPEIAGIYRRLAGLTAQQLDRQVEREAGTPELLRFSCFDTEHQGSFRVLAALALCRTIRRAGDGGLCRLAIELQAQAGEDFLAPALAARLVTQTPEDSYAWGEKQLLKTGLLGTKVRQEAVPPFRYALGGLRWEAREGVCRWAGGAAVPPLDTRWFSLLIRTGNGMDGVLLTLLDGWNVPGLPEAVGIHLYHAALGNPEYSQVRNMVRVLDEQGWTGWENFAVRWARKNSQSVSYWEVFCLLEQMPVSPGEKLAQLGALDRLIGEKRLTLRRGYWPASEVQTYRNKWEQESLRRGENGYG